MKITLKQAKTFGACQEGFLWLKEQKTRDLRILVNKAIEAGHFDWANWGLVHLMSHPQRVMYAVHAAKSVLHLFETKRPGDVRPRKAIEAAEAFLRGEITAYAAADAVDAAADAVDAAAYAAYAADAAACAAADAAANAAYAAAYAAYAADAAAYAAYAAAANAVANAAYAAYAAARRKAQLDLARFALGLLGVNIKDKEN